VTFQFQCPQGHLLEGDESQAHENRRCPQCGLPFVIPALGNDGGDDRNADGQPRHPIPSHRIASPSEYGRMADEALARARPGKTLHIPCPNGHQLDAPFEMLGQDVLCPHCEVQFRLREVDSLEYKVRLAQARERAEAIEEHAVGEAWLKWAIVVSVLVALALVLLIVLSE
jgi:rubredoxin